MSKAGNPDPCWRAWTNKSFVPEMRPQAAADGKATASTAFSGARLTSPGPEATRAVIPLCTALAPANARCPSLGRASKRAVYVRRGALDQMHKAPSTRPLAPEG